MNATFEHVLAQYTPLIKSQIKRLSLMQHYDEAYQVAMIALWDAYRRFTPEKGEFAAFAQLRVRGDLISYVRKEIRNTERFVLTDESTEHLLENLSVEDEYESTGSHFTPFLNQLSPRELLYVEQVLIQGKSIKSLAARHQVTVNTVASWSKSARRKLREMGKVLGDPRKTKD
ncbi:sigma-70 family RNA polymerase sigma factor [Alkalihalobacillus sp. NPDC078783]